MQKWVVPLNIVTATGNATQCYPNYAKPGEPIATAVPGQQVRYPMEGQIASLQCKTDGSTAFTLELYDLSGAEIGVDVSSSNVITNAELTAAIASGKARLIFDQNIAGDGLSPMSPVGPAGFVKGLVARAVGAAASGTCALNLTVHGGYCYLDGSN